MSGLVLKRDPGCITLDGQFGEGGGQILRSSVALAVASSQGLQIENIRRRRRPPGLRPQHLQAVLALASLCQGRTAHAEVGSQRLRFTPGGPVVAGDYRFDIGTAGSTALLLHALVPALCTAQPQEQRHSRLVLTGGTHQPRAPSAGYLIDVWAPAARSIGLEVEVTLVRPGFFPRGGGKLHAQVAAGRPQGRVDWLVRSGSAGPVCIQARAGVARLQPGIAERMLRRVAQGLAAAGLPFDPERDGTVVDHGTSAHSPGAYLELVYHTAPAPAGFIAIGERGVPAETVADRAVADLVRHERTGAPVDPHLSDQLAILLALSTHPAGSSYRTSEITLHLLTHAEVLMALWPVTITVHGELGQPGEVHIRPR
jgi:RNA 3'-terminal phosphate cyclase (ATP)